MTMPFGLGTLRLASPAALLALLVVPLFFAAARRARRGLPAVICRSAAALAIVFVLAGPRLETPRPERGACVIAAIDVSASVQDAAVEAARAFLARLLPRLGPDDVVGSVAFAAHARVIAHPAAGRPSLAALLPAHVDADPDADDTDLGAAYLAADSLCPAGKQAALVLFTDGNETQGSIVAEIALGEPSLPVFPVVPPAAALPAAAIRRLLAPAFAPELSVLPLSVVVESRAPRPLPAVLEVRADEEEAAPVPVELPPGTSLVELPYRFRAEGEFLLRARLLLPPDQPRAPAPAGVPITVTPPARVLLVSGLARPVVAVALTRRGADVDVVPPAALAARLGELADYHAVVLDDVARAGLGDETLERLRVYVARGGALIATGGERLFGDPGFAESPLARVLPVTLEPRSAEPKTREPIALYLLIDRSNSMGYSSSNPAVQFGEKMEYAKRAAIAVLDQLGPSDLVAAIAFDSQPYELGALRPVGEGRAALRAAIERIQYGGGTDFKDALDIARRNLVESGRRVRHVILLTDGDTNRHPEDHAELIAALARAEITVTTIRIGSDTINLELLKTISRATGGEFHHVEHVEALPQLMLRDTRRLIDPTAGLEDAPARIGIPGPMLAGLAEQDLPPVARWAPTRAKPGAELRLYVDAGERRDPLLATWQYELGRAAALPVDFEAGARAWPAWRGFAKLWSQLLLWTMPPARPADRRLEARRLEDGALVRLETGTDAAGPFALRLAGTGDVPLHPVGRRAFAAVVPGLEPGVHLCRLVSAAGAEPLRLVVPARSPSGRESRARGPNLALLARAVALTGGRLAAQPADVVAARPGVGRRRVALAGVLVPLALLLVLGDVAVRRLAS
ncbi:MAG: VWA domain-containing protein [Deltaproteobacteria bacterium]|nr:MAG: VWA domain-containing protein [Deltaproteobacteria bacterium]